MATLTVETIKQAIDDLPETDRAELAAWLNRQFMDAWEIEMDRDFSPGGRGYHLVEKVNADIHAGRFRPMFEGPPGNDAV